MSLITRTYTFTDGTVAYGSQVESEIQNIVTILNSLDAATSAWDSVKVTNSSTTPLIVDNAAGSNSVAVFRANGVDKVTVGSTGVLTCANTIAMSSTKVTGLANGTASTDAAAFGQVPTLTVWATYTPTIVGWGNNNTNLSFWWRRVADTIEIKGTWTVGTAAATPATVTLPNSLTIDSTKMGSANQIAGVLTDQTNTVLPKYALAVASAGTISFGNGVSGTNPFTAANGSSLIATANNASLTFHAPITGWAVV